MLPFEFLTHVVIVMLFCSGFFAAIQPNKIFGIWQNVIIINGENRFSVSPAFGGCLSCSGSLFGSQYFLFIIITNYEFSLYSFLPVAVLMSCMAVEYFASKITFSEPGEKESVFSVLHSVTKLAYIAFLVIPAMLFIEDMLHVYVVFLLSIIGGLSIIENRFLLTKAQQDSTEEMEAISETFGALADDYFTEEKTE